MPTHKAVLDFVGLPVDAPGNLEARLRRVAFRDDGTLIDDGSRSGVWQAACHRFVVLPGQSIRNAVKPSNRILRDQGYAAPELGALHVIARHENRPGVIAARRTQLKVKAPVLRLVVRALGFDVVGAGELAVGLGLARVTPLGAELLTKSGVKLLPGDPIDLVFEAFDAAAEKLGCAPLCAEDRSLVQAVAAYLWTPATLQARQNAWSFWQAETGIPFQIGAALELRDRMTVPDFQPIPTGPAPEPMRTIN